jgi:hypothetical protein
MMTDINAALANVIRKEMAGQRVGVPWLAVASGIPERTVRSILGGKLDVKLYQVEAIARALGMRCSELVAMTEREP